MTLEGLDPAERQLIGDCFVAAAGLQCGFCIPGFALRAKAIVDKNPNPSRDDIAKGIDVTLKHEYDRVGYEATESSTHFAPGTADRILETILSKLGEG